MLQLKSRMDSFWYPQAPPVEKELKQSIPVSPVLRNDHEPEIHSVWKEMKYTSTLWWEGNISPKKKDACRRMCVRGVEIKDLSVEHKLAGQKGLFATESFSQ